MLRVKQTVHCLVIVSVLLGVLSVSPARSDQQSVLGLASVNDELVECEETLSFCDEAVLSLESMVEKQERLIQEQARQLDEIDSESSSWQWEWFLIGIAAGAIGVTTLK